jgi:hypothetical protein
MPSPPKAAPPAVFPTGHARWLWLLLAAALGAWLIILLVISAREPPKSPLQQAAKQNPARFEGKAVDAFGKRHDVRSSRPSAPAPFPLKDGVKDGQGE